MKLLCNTQ